MHDGARIVARATLANDHVIQDLISMLSEHAVEAAVAWVKLHAQDYSVRRDVRVPERTSGLVLDQRKVFSGAAEAKHDAHRQGLRERGRAMEVDVFLVHCLLREPELTLQPSHSNGAPSDPVVVADVVPEILRQLRLRRSIGAVHHSAATGPAPGRACRAGDGKHRGILYLGMQRRRPRIECLTGGRSGSAGVLALEEDPAARSIALR
mmetsp:Transcript_132744/g.296978  ORF Transcript_132744/g.296978 Transcript_132744/m.296978 type:complete len:208 (-) Transcript_132744:25-648(-)